MLYSVITHTIINRYDCMCSISSYNFVKMKHQRDDKSQKITTFLSSSPPTKRASGVEDGSMPSSAVARIRTSQQAQNESLKDMLPRVPTQPNIRQAITGCGKLTTHGYFTLMARVCITSFAKSSIQKIVKTMLRSGTRSLVQPYARMY